MTRSPGWLARPGKAVTHVMRALSPAETETEDVVDTVVPAQRPVPQDRPSVLPTAAYPDWEAIYADNVGRIYRQMFAKVGNRPDAEDLTSQVFLDAMGPLRATASVGEVRAYLLATARTVLARHWRTTLGREVTAIDLDGVDLEDFGAQAAGDGNGEAPERVTAILSGLPERHRKILTLRFLRGYTVKQAATELGVSVANAKVLQHRALRRAAGLDGSAGSDGSARLGRSLEAAPEPSDREGERP